ncbi:uncharacterized protein LOC116415939 [Nasonia vitripennis]|uniref:Endonuclease/exonuclease/phosphatase domain-containing protein n=1 Tax=Nasonia vitripennis TaxID=7425 RepID=A0A7M7PW48_NASVI|nr:uncharacterized protein LOC116415939 [Nasonia vitripennis]
MARILQGNLHRSRLAHDLLTQHVREQKVDVLLISEQYRNLDPPFWVSNIEKTAAIWVPRRGLVNTGTGEDYVRGVGGIQGSHTRKLGVLEDVIREVPGEIVIGGDFNARATEWGMPTTNPRDRAILEMAARLNLIVANEGNTSTYRRTGFGESIPDVTFASEMTTRIIRDWHVTEEYTASDHQYMLFNINEDHQTSTRRNHSRAPRWNTRRMNRETLAVLIQSAILSSNGIPHELGGRERAETIVE